jgi:hypothetical protein
LNEPINSKGSFYEEYESLLSRKKEMMKNMGKLPKAQKNSALFILTPKLNRVQEANVVQSIIINAKSYDNRSAYTRTNASFKKNTS